jgi:6-phosphogluconolactonase
MLQTLRQIMLDAIMTTVGDSTRIADVEEKLNDLWSQIAEAEGKDAILRATTLNLVLYTNDPANAPGLISQISEGHPCRTIVINIDGNAPEALTASPTVFCHPSLGGEGRTQVCCEEILIKAGRDAVSRIPGAVQALLLPDLPVYIFHQGTVSLSDPVIKNLVEVTDGLIVDSATFEDVPAALRSLVALRDMPPHVRMRLFDLDWQRLLPWRRALAQAFDGTFERTLLKSISEVQVLHHDARGEALLFLGWLVSRLDWQLIAGGDANTWRARSGQGDITMRLQPVDNGVPGLKNVHVVAGGYPVAVSLSDDKSCLIAQDGRVIAMRLPATNTGSLISVILDTPDEDEFYDEAVSTAVILATEMHALSQRAGVIVANNQPALARLAARQFVQAARHAIEKRGRFTVALSGGSTPRSLFELLARRPYREQIAWAKVHVFWGDERDVPSDHEDSNQRMAREVLLRHVPIPPGNIHVILTGQLTADQAAARYAEDIRDFFQPKPGELPEFDMILLGLGEDGHTASLFPHTQALSAPGDRIFVANPVPQLKTIRLTLTADVINNADNVVFLVSGKAKAKVLYTVFKGALQPDDYPAQRVNPVNGLLTVIADQDAASMLHQD